MDSRLEESASFPKTRNAKDITLAGIQAPSTKESPPPEKKSLPWSLMALLVWGAGGIFLLMRFFVDLIRINSFVRKGNEVREKNLWLLLEDCMERCQVRGSVKMIVHPKIPIPAAFGLFRAVLIFPEDMYGWSKDKQRAVFCHELAHVKRRDFLTNTIVQIACALNWFNPLVWISMHQFLIEREKACDDFVIHRGASRCEYADILLGIVRNLPRMNTLKRSASVMAHQSDLKRRIKHILSPKAKRKAVTRRALVLTAVLVMFFMIPLTMIKIQAKERQEKTKIQVPKNLQSLIQDLKSGNPEVQKRAAWALGDKEDEKAVPALIETLKDKDPEIRALAAWALGEIKDLRALSPLIEALPDGNTYAREMIVKAVGEFENEQGIEPLAVFCKDNSPDVRAAAVWALGEIPSRESQNAIISALDDSSALVRDAAVVALSRFENRKSVMNLITMLKDRDANIRERTAKVLGSLEDRYAVQALIEALKDKEIHVRISAVVALGEIGDTAALDPLMKLLRDKDARVRSAVVWALDEISLK
jgi:HEAT repeat protein